MTNLKTCSNCKNVLPRMKIRFWNLVVLNLFQIPITGRNFHQTAQWERTQKNHLLRIVDCFHQLFVTQNLFPLWYVPLTFSATQYCKAINLLHWNWKHGSNKLFTLRRTICPPDCLLKTSCRHLKDNFCHYNSFCGQTAAASGNNCFSWLILSNRLLAMKWIMVWNE